MAVATGINHCVLILIFGIEIIGLLAQETFGEMLPRVISSPAT